VSRVKRRFHGGFASVARLALEESFSFSSHGGLLLRDSHANAHALLSELALNCHNS
jgi:hypothetical protein